MNVIEGVVVKELRPIPDERGRVMEILRRDDPFFEGFGQVYITTAHPGVVKAWHYHKKQFDFFCVVSGMMKVVLYDDREGSPTRGVVNELFLGEHHPIGVKIPPLIYHGFKCIGGSESLLINTVTEPYNHEDPDEFRLPAHTEEIPYDWARKDR